jgi:hypothetical protein
MQGKQQIHNVGLVVVATDMRQIAFVFSKFMIYHVYRELNQMAYSLSKEELSMSDGEILFVDINDGVTVET